MQSATQVQPQLAFTVAYSAARVQYVVRRGTVEVVPTVWPNDPRDPLALESAGRLCKALTRVYEASEPADPFTYGADEHHFADGSPRPEAREWFEEQRAEVVRRLQHTEGK